MLFWGVKIFGGGEGRNWCWVWNVLMLINEYNSLKVCGFMMKKIGVLIL